MKNLKTLRKANSEETKKIAKKEWENDFKMQDFLIKKYDYYFTKDNLILEVEKFNNLSISKDFYYDDETDAPEKNLENFIDNNKYNCNYYDSYIEELNRSKLTKFNFCENTNVCVYVNILRTYEEKSQNFVREITNDEMQDILAIYKEQKERYIERITKYFNRYNKNISCIGYWANR